MSPTYLGNMGGGSSTADSGDLVKSFSFGLSLYPSASLAVVALVAVNTPIVASSSWTELASGSNGYLYYWIGYGVTPVADPTFRLVGGDYLTGGVTAAGTGQHVAYARAFADAPKACLVGTPAASTGTRARFPDVTDSPATIRQQVLGFVPTGTVDVAVLNDPYTDDVWYRLGVTRVSSGSIDFRNAGVAYPQDGGVPDHFDASTFELFAYRSGGSTSPELECNWLAFTVEICDRVPPLRQNQRDDIRQGQRTSRQLTVRQRGYL